MRQDPRRRRLVGDAVKLGVVMIALVIAHALVVVIIVSMVRHNTKLGVTLRKRYNGLAFFIAGRRFSPYALMRHTGRRSGRTYSTPVGAYRFRDSFVVGLTYGPDVDWCRNVVAAGHAVLRWRGRDYALERPEIMPMNPVVLRAFPLPARPLLARQFTHCLVLHQQVQASAAITRR